jgi:hypothetical protein
VSTYTYASTDLISGRVLADSLPLTVQSFGMQLNGSGTLTGSLALNAEPAVNAPAIAALEPRRSVLWVLQDGYPVWAGIVWDWPDQGRQPGTLPISAQTIDTLWSHRLVTDTIIYQQVDLFTAFMDLCRYGTSKQSGYISSVSPAATRTPAYLAMVAQNGGVARLVMPQGTAGTAGVPWTASYTYSDLTQISGAWQDMCASGNLEYAFVPGLDSSGNLAIFLRLAYLRMGRTAASSGYNLIYPGNAIDYGYQRTGSQSSNMVWATAPPNGAALQWQSAYPHGSDPVDLADGVYPLMESNVSWQGSWVVSQAQIDGFADGEVAMKTRAMTNPMVTVGAGYPRVRDIILGDATTLVATSPLHPPGPNGQPGLQQRVRVVGWTAYPPGPQQAEKIQLQTSAVGA